MNDIPQERLHDLLAARIDGVVPGLPPTERVLAGARRRRIRTRVVTGTAGLLAVAGAVTAVAGHGGSGGRTAVAPGQTPTTKPSTKSSAAKPSETRGPVVTRQLGLAPGQAAPGPDDAIGMQVVMSGTVDGRPWQVYGATQVDPPEQGLWAAHSRPGPGKHLYCFMFGSSIEGRNRIDGGGGCGETDVLSDPVSGPIRILSGGADVRASDDLFALQGMVAPNVAKLVWTGQDGFHEETTPLLTPLGRNPFFFMAGPVPGKDDRVAAYDSAGNLVASKSIIADPPDGLGMTVIENRPSSPSPTVPTSPTKH